MPWRPLPPPGATDALAGTLRVVIPGYYPQFTRRYRARLTAYPTLY